MSTNAQFTATARCSAITISTANTNRNGSGTIGQFMLAGASGSRVERIVLKATGATTNGMIRLYTYDGTTYRLFQEVDVTAATPGATTKAWTSDLTLGSVNPMFLPSGYALGASTENAESFNVVAVGGDF